MSMVLSPRGAAFLRLQEGFRPDWYLDKTGTPTIGIGFTWASDSFRRWWTANKGVPFARGTRITATEADAVLQLLVAEEYGAAVNKFFGLRAVPQHVFDAACSVTFNCGPGTLEDRWATAAKRGAYAEAARLLRTTRITSKGRKLKGLIDRRAREALLLEKGVYTGVPAAVPPPARPEPEQPAPQPAPEPKTVPAATGWAAIFAAIARLFRKRE